METTNEICPLCLSDEFGDFGWSETLQTKVCHMCRIEMSADYYLFSDSPGNYIVKAAHYLGVDQMEVRRRYLTEIMNREFPIPGTNIDLCRQQLRIIKQHQMKNKKSPHWIDNILLEDELSQRAFGYDFDGITIVIE